MKYNDDQCCVPEVTLSVYVEGDLELEQAELVAKHVERCRSCENLLLNIDADQTQDVCRMPEVLSNIFHEPELERLIRRATLLPLLKQRRPLARQRKLNQYELLEELGRGGMGCVYFAHHSLLKCPVVLKTLSGLGHLDDIAIERFQQEIAALGQIKHANVILATDAGECDGVPYLVMEYAEGIDAGWLVRAIGPLSVANACEIVRQAALGLQSIHDHGYVHRDLKPSNLLVCSDGAVKILDLGLAKFKEHVAKRGLTNTGDLVGTPGYISPEQVQGTTQPGRAADLYSLGCTLFTLLTGAPPFAHESHRDVASELLAHATQMPPSLRELRQDAPEALATFISSLLAKSPIDRPATASETAQRLAIWTDGHSIAATVEETCKLLDEVAESGTVDELDEAARSTPKNADLNTQPESLHEIPRRQARPNRLYWLAGFLALCVVGIIGLLNSGQADRNPSGWQDLLAAQPTPLVWNGGSGRGSWEYRKDRRELRVNSTDLSLFTVGKVKRSNYKLQLGMDQAHWIGGGGIAIGIKDNPDDPILRFQVFQLRQNRSDKPGEELAIHRLKVSIDRTNGLNNVQIIQVAQQNLPMSSSHEQLLEIAVTSQGVLVARWAGMDLPKLAATKCNERFSEDEYVGGIGIFSGGTGYTNFTRFQLLENEANDGGD